MLHNGQEFAELYPMPEMTVVRRRSADPAQKRSCRGRCAGARRRRTGRGHVDALSAPHCLRRSHAGLTSPILSRGWMNRGRSLMPTDWINAAADRRVPPLGPADDGRLEKFYVVLILPGPERRGEFPGRRRWIDLLSGWQPTVKPLAEFQSTQMAMFLQEILVRSRLTAACI